MKLVLGVEGGGSHTHAVVADTTGVCLGVGGSEAPSNWEDVGIEAAAGAIRACVREALDGAGLEPDDIAASMFSLAGIDFPLDEDRLSGVPLALGLGENTRVGNDAYAALRAGTDRPFGVAVIAGTGSVVAGRNPAGEEFRTLGLGPVYGDYGGTTEVSEAAVTAVARALIDRGPPTMLTELMCECARVSSAVELVEGIGRGRIDSTSFIPQLFQAAAGGDAVARGLLSEAGLRLGESAVHVVGKLGMQDEIFDMVLTGGLFRGSGSIVRDALMQIARPAVSNATFVGLDDPPVIGAVLLAMEMAGETPDSAIRSTLTRATSAALGLNPG